MKSFRFLFPFILLSLPILTAAQVVINEIMFDLQTGSDTGREWVEIYNSGTSPVDISSWKFLESATASNHGLTLSQGTANLSGGGFAVISSDPAKFLIDWPSFSGNLFKASFSSLNNTNGTVILKDGSLSVVDQVQYASSQGANGDGNSLQKTNQSWLAALPTPGLVNATSSISYSNSTTTSETATTTNQTSGSNSDNSSNVLSAHSSPVPLSIIPQVMEFEISAGRDRLTTIGNSVTFRVLPTKLLNMSGQGIVYDWSFGDGTKGQGDIVNHAYRFPGDYAVVVNAAFSDKQAVSRLQVKVIAPNLLLSRVSGGMEISNKSGTEINLEGWSLDGNKKTFVFPKDTLIPSGKKITFADEVTGMNNTGTELVNPMGKSFGAISVETVPIVPIELTQTSTSTPVNLLDIQAKINEVKDKLAKISKNLEVSKQNDNPVLSVSPHTLKEELKSIDTAESSSTALNTAIVFETPKQSGIVSSLFSWPIKGFNFIKHLFVED